MILCLFVSCNWILNYFKRRDTANVIPNIFTPEIPPLSPFLPSPGCYTAITIPEKPWSVRHLLKYWLKCLGHWDKLGVRHPMISYPRWTYSILEHCWGLVFSILHYNLKENIALQRYDIVRQTKILCDFLFYPSLQSERNKCVTKSKFGVTF